MGQGKSVSPKTCFFFIGLSFAVLFSVALMTGPAPISVLSLFSILKSNACALIKGLSLFPEGSDIALLEKDYGFSQIHSVIIIHLRLPRIIMACLLGAGFALGGAVTQAIFRNPLADPSLIGVGSGASLGALMALNYAPVAWLGLGWMSLGAFLGALSVVSLIYLFFRLLGGSCLTQLLLIGLAVNAFIAALVGLFLMHSSDPMMRDYLSWAMGRLTEPSWDDLALVAPLIILPSVCIMRCANYCNVLSLGMYSAQLVGVPLRLLLSMLFICIALMVGVAVAFAGVIGFLGLIAPHMVRIWIGSDNRYVFIGSSCFGALLLLASDTFARAYGYSVEMPLGMITALIGAPLFLYLVLRTPLFRSENF